ncbi:MAG: signal peptide-containing protein [Planctomycetota bacterium]
MRLIKTLMFSLIAVATLGTVFLGKSLPSYVKTSALSVQEAVQDSVPIEFELKRARNLIDAILPQLQAQIRRIAHEEVEIARLEKDIKDSVAQLEKERSALVALRKTADQTFVSASVQSSMTSASIRQSSRKQLVGKLHGRFERLKQTELAVQSKQRLLEGRQKSLAAAMAQLEKTRDRKIELEQKIETLAANHRLIQNTKIESGVAIDGSRLSQADQLLTQIQVRLDVAQRVLTHEQDLESPLGGDDTLGTWLDEQEVLDAIDQHLESPTVTVQDQHVSL